MGAVGQQGQKVGQQAGGWGQPVPTDKLVQ